MPLFVRNKPESSSAESWKRAFAVTAFFMSLAAALFWLDFFRSAEARITLLVIGRGQLAGQGEEISANLGEIGGTLAFYDRLLANTDHFEDPYSGDTPDQRRARWQRLLSIAPGKQGSTLTVTARTKDSDSALELARAGTANLLGMSSLYYDIKKDADLRIIDGPTVSAALPHPVAFALVSLLSGIGATLIFFLLLRGIPFLFSGARTARERKGASQESALRSHAGETVPWIDPQKFVPVRPEGLTFENDGVQSNAEPGKPGAASPLTAHAPANLPIADDASLPFASGDLPFTFEEEGENVDTHAGDGLLPEEPANLSVTPLAEDADLSARKEPTSEEYKRRLNELLAGSNESYP